jgi:hypothetical protein
MATTFNPVRLGTLEYINLSTNLVLGQAKIDGVIVVSGNRILVKAQTDKAQNGIYTIGSNGSWSRASDFAAASSVDGGTIVFIQEGDNLADTGWVISTNGSTTVGSGIIEFEKFSVNLKIQGASIPSSIILRAEKGYPLTIEELDNNFKYLAVSLTQKLNTVDFNSISVRDKINALSASQANLNSWKLQDKLPSFSADQNTIAVRDGDSNLTATNFIGHLTGYADDAYNADHADIATDVDGVVQITNGGTGSTDAVGARTKLAVLGTGGGEQMTGKLKLAPGAVNYASLRIPPYNVSPAAPENGDVWASNSNLYYRLAGTTSTIAPLENPVFTGSAQTPDALITSNSATIANTKYVWLHRTEINTALSLKAPIAAPALTRDANLNYPTTPTPVTTDGRFKVQGDVGYDPLGAQVYIEAGSTKIANTEYVVNRISKTLLNYYTGATTDAAIATALTPYSTSTQVDGKITTALTSYYTKTAIDTTFTNYTNSTNMNIAISSAVSTRATTAYVNEQQPMWGTSKKYVQSTEPTNAVEGDFWFKV